jgi:hypothetical protein
MITPLSRPFDCRPPASEKETTGDFSPVFGLLKADS